MGKYKSLDELPEELRSELEGMDLEALALRVANSEVSVMKNKSEIEKVKGSSEKEKSELLQRLETLEKDRKSEKVDRFLEGKNMTDEEKQKFNTLIEKGIDLTDAYNISAKESIQASQNQTNTSKNTLDGKNTGISGSTITKEEYSQLAEKGVKDPVALKEFASIDTKVSSGEITLI